MADDTPQKSNFEEARDKMRGNSLADRVGDSTLIHPSFPGMGSEKRAHEGSQSTTPEKGNP